MINMLKSILAEVSTSNTSPRANKELPPSANPKFDISRRTEKNKRPDKAQKKTRAEGGEEPPLTDVKLLPKAPTKAPTKETLEVSTAEGEFNVKGTLNPTTSEKTTPRAKVQQPKKTEQTAVATTSDKEQHPGDNQTLIARIQELGQRQSRDHDYVRKNLRILYEIVQRKFDDFAAEIVKVVGPLLGALRTSDASTTKKVIRLDMGQAQLDGRLTSVEDWMNRHDGELVDDMKGRQLGQELLESYATLPPEVADEPETKTELETTTELDREAEPEAASTSIVGPGLTGTHPDRSIVSTPKPFHRPHYDSVKRLGLAELMPHKTRNLLIQPLKDGELRVRVVKNSKFDEVLMKKVEKQLAHVIEVGLVATRDATVHAQMLGDMLLFHRCWVQTKGESGDFGKLNSELKAVVAHLLGDIERVLFKKYNWANEEKVRSSHSDSVNVHEAVQGQWALTASSSVSRSLK
jgi:hypothetical protein